MLKVKVHLIGDFGALGSLYGLCAEYGRNDKDERERETAEHGRKERKVQSLGWTWHLQYLKKRRGKLRS